MAPVHRHHRLPKVPMIKLNEETSVLPRFSTKPVLGHLPVPVMRLDVDFKRPDFVTNRQHRPLNKCVLKLNKNDQTSLKTTIVIWLLFYSLFWLNFIFGYRKNKTTSLTPNLLDHCFIRQIHLAVTKFYILSIAILLKRFYLVIIEQSTTNYRGMNIMLLRPNSFTLRNLFPPFKLTMTGRVGTGQTKKLCLLC